MTEFDAKVRLVSIAADGFDLSRVYELDMPFTDGEPSGDFSVRVRCSQCEALVINGVPCHEARCPNIIREIDIDEYDSEYNPEEE